MNGSGFMDFDPNDGDPITGIGVVGPYVIIGKPRKLWVLTNVATATARMISNNIGISAHRSIAAGPEGTYFLAEDRGVYVTNGTKLTPIADIITPTLQGIQPGLRSQAAGQYFNAHYYLSVPLTGSNNDTILDYDAILGSWWKHTIGVNQWAIWHSMGPGTQAYLFDARATSALVDQAFVSGVWQDNGSNFQWVYRGPWLSPVYYRHKWYETPYYRKRMRQMRVDGYGTVDFSLAKDFAGAETLWASSIFGAQAISGGAVFGGSDGSVYGAADGSYYGPPSIFRYRAFSLGVANSFSIVFSATSNTPDAITSYIAMVVPRKDMVMT